MKNILIALLLLILPAAADCAVAAAPDPLAGSEWLVTEIGDQQALDEAYLQFRSEGKVGGRTGVNSFGGTYTAREASLSFGPLMMTRMAGAPELMEQEARLVAALERVDEFRREGIHLTLLADGEPVLHLRQRDWD